MKDKFLNLKTYEEYKLHRHEFKGLKIDKDIIEHMGKIFPKLLSNGLDEEGNPIELFKEPRREKGKPVNQ